MVVECSVVALANKKKGYVQGRERGSSVGRESRCCWVQELNKNRAWTSPVEYEERERWM